MTNSVDPCISNANINVDGGKKSNTSADAKTQLTGRKKRYY